VPETPATEHSTPVAATVTEAAGLKYLDPQAVRLTRAGARIDAVVEGGAPQTGVQLYRAFPLSEPERYVSLRNEKNEELGLLVEPSRLDPVSRAIVEEELRRRYVLPVVQRVVAIRERFEVIECRVETDRGPCQFSVRNLRENVLRPAPSRFILTDVDGNRYDIPDLRALPPASQAQILAHL
jgi:hypothetical protein